MPGLRVWFLLLLFCLTGPVFGIKVATLPQLNRPNNVVIDGDRLFISDCPSVYIYSIKDGDIQLKKKFGRQGSGPIYLCKRPGENRLFHQDRRIDKGEKCQVCGLLFFRTKR
jgi:hypothetical protein